MSDIRNSACVLLLLAATACWGQSQSAQVVDDRLQPPGGPSSMQKAGDSPRTATLGHHAAKKKPHAGVAHPPAALVEEPKPVAPPPPTLAQQAPSVPQVTYRNGLLTVTANNCTLSDILNLVRSKTGATIEYPPTMSQERVAAVVGPAPAPQVLTTLLNGTRFDYILLGMAGRPDLLQRAIITPREASGAVSAAAGGPPSQARAANPPAGGDEEPDMSSDETAEQPEEVPPPQPAQAQPQPAQPQPGMQAAPNQQFPNQVYPNQVPPPRAPQGDQAQPTQPQQPKTPEQLLQELQRLQQQQQQQPQQQ